MALSLKTWVNSFCNMYRIVLNVLSLAAAQRRSVYGFNLFSQRCYDAAFIGFVYSRNGAMTQRFFLLHW